MTACIHTVSCAMESSSITRSPTSYLGTKKEITAWFWGAGPGQLLTVLYPNPLCDFHWAITSFFRFYAVILYTINGTKFYSKDSDILGVDEAILKFRLFCTSLSYESLWIFQILQKYHM